MSSSRDREPLSGVILQNQKVVGAICLPEERLPEFIAQFNHCYGPLELHIGSTHTLSTPRDLFPVGANRLRTDSHMLRGDQGFGAAE